GLVVALFVDLAGVTGPAAPLSRLVLLAAILMPAGFFLSVVGHDPRRPNRLYVVILLGPASLVTCVVAAAVGLLTLRSGREAAAASASGSPASAPACRSARAATVIVHRESTRSSTRSTGPRTCARPAARSGPTVNRSQTPASRNALLPPDCPVGPPSTRSSVPR